MEAKRCESCKQVKESVRMCTDHPDFHDGYYCTDCVPDDSWPDDPYRWEDH